MKRLFGGGKAKEKKQARHDSWGTHSSFSSRSSRDQHPLPIPNPSIRPDAMMDHGYDPQDNDYPDEHTPESSVNNHVYGQYPSAPMMQTTPPKQKAPKRRWFSLKPPPGASVPRTNSASSTSSMYARDDITTGQIQPPSGRGPPSMAPSTSHHDANRTYASMDTTHPHLQSMDAISGKPKKKKFGLFNIEWKSKKRQPTSIPPNLPPIPLARSASEPSRPGTIIDPDHITPTTPMPPMDQFVPVARTSSQITRQSILGRQSLQPQGMIPPSPLGRKPSTKRPGGLARFLSFKKQRPPSPIAETPLTRVHSLPPSRPATLLEPEAGPSGASVHRQPSLASAIPPSEHRTVMEYPAPRGGSLHRGNTQTSTRTRGTAVGLSRAPTVDHQQSAPPQASASRHQSVRDRAIPPPPQPRGAPQLSKTERIRLWHHINQPLIAHATRALIDPPLYDFVRSLCTGRKRAVCIGVNYIGSKYPLKGCINDAEHAREYLVRYLGFHSSNIAMLTDTGKNKPTRAMLLGACKWLVEGAQPHDSLFFHYSGHGGQAPDTHGDESDGWDEVIYPSDYKEAGFIDDDTLHRMLVDPLPAGCRLTGIFDACHSGTVLDLPFIYSATCRQRSSHISNRSRKRQQTGADVISLSGCKDGETSADTFQGGVAVGAMSWAFLSTLKRNKDLTYKQLLAALRATLDTRYKQRPQLGSSHPIDPNEKFVI